jgi:CspA family cold shock protein
MLGKIRRIMDRGYGFIRGDDGKDYFFHRSSVEGTTFEALSEGQSVEFDVEPDRRGRGPRATRVRTG